VAKVEASGFHNGCCATRGSLVLAPSDFRFEDGWPRRDRLAPRSALIAARPSAPKVEVGTRKTASKR